MFKSLMFMRFGYVILYSFHRQDSRLIRIFLLSPVLKIIFFFSGICIVGLPFLSAFFLKDFIIELIFSYRLGLLLVFLLLVNLGFRIYYVIKIFFLKIVLSDIVCIVVKRKISVIFRFLCIIFLINLFISNILIVNYERFIFKFFIYLIIFYFIYIKLKFEWIRIRFGVLDNVKGIWNGVRILDVFYFNICNYRVRGKIILLVNWWGIILLILFI